MPATLTDAALDGQPPPRDEGRRRSWVRSILLPALLVVIWFAAAGVGGPFFGRIDEVSSNDQASFLPASADATLVGQRFIDFVGDSQIPGIVIVTSDFPLDDPTLRELTDTVASLTDIDGSMAPHPCCLPRMASQHSRSFPCPRTLTSGTWSGPCATPCAKDYPMVWR